MAKKTVIKKTSYACSQLDFKKYYGCSNQPVIFAENREILLGSNFNPLLAVMAYDVKDGNITNKIKVSNNNVKTNELGAYIVVYEVENSRKYKSKEIITVCVKEKSKKFTNNLDNYVLAIANMENSIADLIQNEGNKIKHATNNPNFTFNEALNINNNVNDQLVKLTNLEKEVGKNLEILKTMYD